MTPEKEKLLMRKNELVRRSIVKEQLTIGGVYELLVELNKINELLGREEII